MKKRTLQAMLYCFLLITTAYGQGWEREYHVDTVPIAQSINYTTDGGFLLSCKYLEDFQNPMIAYLLKTDANGDTLWTKKHPFLSGLSSTKQTTDGGYIITGYDHLSYQGGTVSLSSSNIHLAKLDANGDTVWTKVYNGGGNLEYAYDVEQTSDGGYALVGSTNSFGAGGEDAYLIKTDANGDTLWTRTYGGTNNEALKSIKQTLDGGYILAGSTNSFGAGGKDAYLIKTDANGIVQWAQHYGNSLAEEARTVQQTIDGGYIFVGSRGNSNIYLVKTDANGTVQWTQLYGGSGYHEGSSVIEGVDGGYFITATAGSDIYILKVNSTGIIEWTRNFNKGYSVGIEAVRVGNGYTVLGYSHYSGVGQKGYLNLIKMDSLGTTFTNFIKGNVFNDTSSNCLKEAGERNFVGILIEAIGAQTWYATTDTLGNYCIPVDTGFYTVNVSEPLYWQTCANSVVVNMPNFSTTDTVHFPLQAQVNCPLMYVDIAAPFLRTNGNGSHYTVNYCNHGTIDAVNATVDVTIDPDLQVLNTSIPIASQTGNVLTFNLGTVTYGDCGSFTIQVIANPTAILGQTHCTEAHIYPDSICLPNPWTGPIIDASANCLNDSVHFELRNIGGSIFNSQNFYVFEDHFIMNLTSNTTGNIPVNNSFDLSISAAPGKTYRIEVAQAAGYPFYRGDAIASAAIEGCVPYADGTFNTGFITQFSNGNSAPSIAVDCQQNRGSYDPNDKSAQPVGYGSQHKIYSYTDLDYKIRFQNTGTDTAFLVVIRDTISPLLDLTTLTMGASSHPYTWRIYGAGILEITFANIMLPDSNVNEPASNGFVRYRIEQKAGNAIGSVIYNAADIYFDFNAPITTNETWHTIDTNFVPVFLKVEKVFDEELTVKAYPNPFRHSTTIEVEGKEYEQLQLIVFDVTGRMVKIEQVEHSNKIELRRGNLQPGIYLYELSGKNQRINTGKIIVQ